MFVKVGQRLGMSVALKTAIGNDLPFEASQIGSALVRVDRQFPVALHHYFPDFSHHAQLTYAKGVEVSRDPIHGEIGHGGETEPDGPFDSNLIELRCASEIHTFRERC